MEIQVTGFKPPHPYSDSKVLKDPRRQLTFNEVLSRIRRFSKEGILHMGTQLQWHIKYHPETVNTAREKRNESNFILRAYSPLVMSIGCACAPKAGKPRPSEIEFRLLCWELATCVDTISEKTFLQKYEY